MRRRPFINRPQSSTAIPQRATPHGRRNSRASRLATAGVGPVLAGYPDIQTRMLPLLENELANVHWDFWPAAARSWSPAPIVSETSAMPMDNGLNDPVHCDGQITSA